ncbi:MAG: hypothetical protein R2911_28325 [Caldilineaceae bacterium]
MATVFPLGSEELRHELWLTFQLELTPVTPVHIGAGEELPGYAYLDDFTRYASPSQ